MAGVYNIGKNRMSTGGAHVWGTTGVTIRLVGSGYTPNPDHSVVGDLGANELTDPSYSPQALAGQARSQNDTLDRMEFTATNLTFAGLDGAVTPAYAVAVDDASSNLLWYNALPGAPAPNSGDYTLNWGSGSGILFTLDD